MSSLRNQEVLRHAHGLVVEYCLLNGESHTNLINALTRDIYHIENTQETDAFQCNIQKCIAPSHHKYNRKLHIIHFSQIKWISTLEQRPECMLPTAHHLIVFFNDIDISNIDLRITKSIQEEFIVQCIMSMNPEDDTKWEQYLARYCIPYDFCPNYKELLSLKGKTKNSKECRDFICKHSWKCFVNDLQKWCNDVLNELKLTPKDALLYRLTQSIKQHNVQTNIASQDIIHKNGVNIDENKEETEVHDDVETKEDQQQCIVESVMHKDTEQEILILSDDNEEEEEEDHHGLKLMSLHSTTSQNEVNEEDLNDNNDDIEAMDEDNHAPKDTQQKQCIPSMPSLEMDTQSMRMIEDDDFEPIESTEDEEEEEEEVDEELLSDLEHINNDKDQRGLFERDKDILTQNVTKDGMDVDNDDDSPDLCNGTQIHSNVPQSEVSTSELLQSQKNVNNTEESEYTVTSRPIHGLGFNLKTFGTKDTFNRSELLPQIEESETESPPENNSVLPSQIAIDYNNYNDYLSQNKPPLDIDNIDIDSQRGKKRTYEEIERLSDELLTQNVNKKQRINDDDDGVIKTDNIWPNWMKKDIEVTVELEDDIFMSKIRKISKEFVLVKIVDEDAPKKYKKKQFKVYYKDKAKIERVIDINETGNTDDEDDDDANSNNMEMDEDDNREGRTYNEAQHQHRRNSVNDYDKAIVWQIETETQQSQDNIATPPELTQEMNNNNNDNKSDTIALKSLLKTGSDYNNNNRVRWDLTLSQEQRESTKEKKSGRFAAAFDDISENDDGIEVGWDEDNESNEMEKAAVFQDFEPTTFSSDPMPPRLINPEYITDPDRACGIEQNNKFRIRGKKQKKKSQKIPWSEQETNALIKGYQKYKKYQNAPKGKEGIWAYIMKDPKYGKVLIKNNRENANICDKWRYLVRTKDERIQHLLDDDHNSTQSKIPKLPTRPVT